MTMSARARASVAIMAAIVFGAAVGATGEHMWLARGAKPAMSAMDSRVLIGEMDRRLHLDPSQRDSIMRILNRNQTAVDSAWAMVRPRIRSAIDSSQAEILGVLRPNQRAPYLAWLAVAHKGMAHSSM